MTGSTFRSPMNRDPLLERRSPLGIPYALLILIVFFFLLPSGFRAARLSLGQKENNVKDWLPSDFPETAELRWFEDHFAGESFVLATWPGCTRDDQRLKIFEQKLLHECDTFDPSSDFPLELAEAYRRAKEVGNDLELLRSGDDFYNWGGQKEKWLATPSGEWYFITPDGRLYRWEERRNALAGAWRGILRSLGRFELKGTFVTAFGEEPGRRVANPFYNDTSLLCATLFHSVQTGETIVDELARDGGALWPVDFTDETRREVVARRLAMQRLTGTLFAPAMGPDFDWTARAFREAIPQERRDQLPEDFDAIVEATLARELEEGFDGSLEQLRNATLDRRTDVWYAVYDAAEVQPPPRLTCVMVTLTDLAKDNLGYALGRGVLGQPRGRLLTLAAESGVQPPPPPSLAPPPFNRRSEKPAPGVVPLRMGGPPVDNTAIDEEGTVTLVRLVGYSVLLGIVLSYLCFRSLKITIMVFVVGGSAAMLSMAIVWWTSGRVDAILMSMPSLVYVLGLSGAIHVINYYRDEVRARGLRGAPGRALRHALLPCTLASLTTAIGLVSLFTSNLTPISNFGFYSAVGVVMTLGILFSYLPAALETFVPRFGRDETTGPSDEIETETAMSRWWAGVGRWITSHYVAVTGLCLIVLVLGAWGLRDIKTSVQLLKLFDPEARIIDDYAWLETNFGKLVPMELIVRVPPQMQREYAAAESVPDGDDAPSVDALEMLERAELVQRIRNVVNQTLGEPGRGVVGRAMSAITFLPPLPEPTNRYSSVRAKYNRDLLESRNELRKIDYLCLEETDAFRESELWRISLRVAALSDVDYGRFIGTLRESVEPVLQAYETRSQLLRALTTSPDGSTGKLDPRSRVLVVGSQSPPGLLDADLLTDDEAIDSRGAYLSTLGELLSGERITSPDWLEVSSEKRDELVSNEKWPKFVQSFDAVIWLGGSSFRKEDFALAKQLIDAEAIRAKSSEPVLLAGGIPDSEGLGPIQVVYTGVVPVVYKAQRTLLTSLTESIGLAFVLIAGVMILLLNPGSYPVDWLKASNLRDGLIAGMVAMIPNVFPVVVVFGVMCHMGIEIDIGTMMTASVAMGVAVDDTIHFLSWFRTNLDRGLDRIDAVIETYRRVGPAMTQTTIVGGLGLFVFALSTFTPTQRFGTLMLVMLATALVGDLILLPALLAGPAGRWFKSRRRPVDHPETDGGQREMPASEEAERADVSDADSLLDSEEEPIPRLRIHFPPGQRTDSTRQVKRK